MNKSCSFFTCMCSNVGSTCRLPHMTKKNKCCISFEPSSSKECSGVIDNTVGIIWCQHYCHWCQWPKSHVAFPISHNWPKEYSGVLEDTFSVMWHWYQHQWHHMTKCHVTPHFSCLNLRNGMIPLVIMLLAWCYTDLSVSVIK